ncbi:N-acyl homoserine lactonase family protein [Flagellimonas lutaonensis]|uniref:Metallo-beta-lactamase n=1 Tax=Flagellimonas lutaonensis TaxID=516051 RepID=A0A0D5YT94_9FLAO|nr:N-acyl homoserine lactonase family protein [Allomuricauda lutaonensis]AKA35076.1 metallo-beta-lactamase [Allomuricauda lutaonensis]
MKRTLLLLAILGLVSCKQTKKEVAENQAAATDSGKVMVKLYALDGGTVQVNQLELFSQDTTYTGQSRVFADAYYVIEHPKGTLMWDAGLPESLVGLPEPYTDPSGAFTVSRSDSLATQLASIGLTVDDIEYLALSHTHFDHSGHAEQLKNATWLVQETEYDFVTSEEVQKSNPEVYNAIDDLENIRKIKGDYDVFGDGTVVMKYMPGHTPGHQVLFVDLAEHGPLLLSGDLYHFSENREFRRIPIFNHDVAQTIESMDTFEAFAKEKNAKVYLQHSQEDFDKFPKTPNYLK